ncbi:MAG: aryl-sulfate sulfotransferase [Vicingaceae bacterium]
MVRYGSIFINKGILFLATIAFLISVQSCKKEEVTATQVDLDELLSGEIKVELNPSGRAPLTAMVSFLSKSPSVLSVTVKGDVPISGTWGEYKREHHDAILGLYPNRNNLVELTISDAQGRYSKTEISITTSDVYDGLPDIQINSSSPEFAKNGLILSDFHIGNTGFFTSFPFAFDQNGVVRWCLDLREYKEIAWTTRRSRNGNLMYMTGGTIYQVDPMGFEIKKIPLPGYDMHHDFIEMPNGNLLLAVTKYGKIIEKGGPIAPVEDHIIEVSSVTGSILREWDLSQLLDVDRVDVADGGSDWFHMNGIAYSESDDCLIVSGRNQGVVKVNGDNELIWILAPHKGWGNSGPLGNGESTIPFLLTAVDEGGNPYPGGVQSGEVKSTSFDWPWGQHAPFIMPNGHLMIFDNGLNRRFTGSDLYSRAVEYEINDLSKTVKETWSYGESRGSSHYSSIISNADYHATEHTVLFSPGFSTATGPKAWVVEVTYPDKQVVFEATLDFKNLTAQGDPGWGTIDIVYRSHRFELYP